MTGPVTVIAPGPPEHGVVRYALRTAAASGAAFVDLPPHCYAEAWSTVLGDPPTGLLHAHYTDQLFGARCEDGPARLARLVDPGRRLVVTLHDVPVGDGTARDRRRAAAYGAVAATADAVIACSCHERNRLRACGITAAIEVIPLSWEPLPPPRPAHARSRPVVGVMGFLFPGKGHADVIAAARQVGQDVEVWALGSISVGHDDLGRQLMRQADRVGVPFRITGFLADDDLAAIAARVDVPVAPHTQVSASASINTWIGGHRRPLARANHWSRELAASAPGAVKLYDPGQDGGLVAAIGIALADPAATWMIERPAHLSPAFIGARHAALYRRVQAPS